MTILSSIENELKIELKRAIIQAQLCEAEDLPEIILEIPKDKAHGDFATNIAMQLARIAKQAPRQIATQIVENLDMEKGSIDKTDIAGPGFINFFMDQSYLRDVVKTILTEREHYGKTNIGEGKRIQVEFVSMNP